MTTNDEDRPSLSEYRDNPFINRLPDLLATDESVRAMIDLPTHSDAERRYPSHFRCHCLLRLSNYFDPLERQIEFQLLVSMLIRQGYLGRNPNTTDFLHRLHNDYERVFRKDIQARLHPVESTASGIAMIGVSGIGKTRSVQRVLRLYPQVIRHTEPFSLDQVVWLRLECPHKGSAKQLCISFFQEMDTLLHERFRAKYGGSRSSMEGMLIDMAALADRYALGLLVIDEIQHLTRASGANREDLLNFLVALVNTIGIPVLIVGTPAALPVLQGALRQARRGSGLGNLYWPRFENDATWNYFIERMWRFQWTHAHTPLTDELRAVLYEESQGIIDLAVKLYMMTQLHVILRDAMAGRDTDERLTVALFRHVAKKSFMLVKPMIDALKRNDMEALAEFDDLKPLNDHMNQVFQEAIARLALREAAGTAPSPQATVAADGEATILAALAQAKSENPGLGPLELMAVVAKKLQGHKPEVAPAKPSPARPKKAPAAQPSDPNDLRVIIASAAEISGYDALLAAGAIKPPLRDVAA